MKKSLGLTIFAGILGLIFSAPAIAQPSISGISGTLAHGSTFRITGNGFGKKDPAQPLVWADFEAGLQPTPLGLRTSWDILGGFVHSASCPGVAVGTYCAAAEENAPSGAWGISVNYPSWNAVGQKSYIYRLARKNFLVTNHSQNWKTWRLWAFGTRWPDIYVAEGHGRVYTETSAPVVEDTGYWANLSTGTTDWVAEEYIFRGSSVDRKDGLLAVRYNGRDVASGSVTTRFSYPAETDMTENWVVHFIYANLEAWNPAWQTSNRVWVDDVYVDTAWSRVMVGNAPTYSDCTALVPQIPSQWSDSQIVAVFHRGRFVAGERVYLYVVDSEGRTSQGLPLVVPGGDGVAPSAPTRLRMAR